MNSDDSFVSATPAALKRLRGRFEPQHDLSHVFMGAAQVFAIRLAGAGLAYASVIFLARWLGTFQFGIYAYVWVWVIILSVPFSLGYCSSALRFLPDYLARGKWRRLSGFLNQSFAVITLVSLTGSLVCAALMFMLKSYIEPYYFLPLLIGLLCVPLQTVLNQFEATSRAFGWVHLAYVPGYIIRPILLIGVVGALASMGENPKAFDAMWAVFAACVVSVIAQGLPLVSGIRARAPEAKSRHAYHTRHWTSISLSFVMIDGFRMLLESGDVLMIGRLLDPDSVAVYYAAIRTGSLIAFIYFAVIALAVPKFSKIHSTGTRDELQRFVSGVVHLMFWPSLLTAIALALAGPLVLSLFGPAFTMGYPALLAVLVGLVLRTAIGPVEYLLNMTGHHRDTLRAFGVAAVANIGLNLVLIPQLGIIGAAIATYIAVIGGNLWLYVLVRRRLGIDALVFPFRRHRLSAVPFAAEAKAQSADSH